MRKGIGPQGLGAPKSVAKQTSWDKQKVDSDYQRSLKRNNEWDARAYSFEKTKGREYNRMDNDQLRRTQQHFYDQRMAELETSQLINARNQPKSQPKGAKDPYNTPAKQVGRNLADVADKKREKADKVEAKGKAEKAERLRNKASKLDEKHVKKAFKNIDLNFRA